MADDLGPLTKVSANFIGKSVDALDAAAEQTGDSRTDALNRAIQLYARIVQLDSHGHGWGRLRMHSRDGRPVRIEVNRPWWRFW